MHKIQLSLLLLFSLSINAASKRQKQKNTQPPKPTAAALVVAAGWGQASNKKKPDCDVIYVTEKGFLDLFGDEPEYGTEYESVGGRPPEGILFGKRVAPKAPVFNVAHQVGVGATVEDREIFAPEDTKNHHSPEALARLLERFSISIDDLEKKQ